MILKYKQKILTKINRKDITHNFYLKKTHVSYTIREYF